VTSVNLAISLALSGKRVILLEADLRQPMVHEYLGLQQDNGLSNVLAGTKQLAEALQVVRPMTSCRPKGADSPGHATPCFCSAVSTR